MALTNDSVHSFFSPLPSQLFALLTPSLPMAAVSTHSIFAAKPCHESTLDVASSLSSKVSPLVSVRTSRRQLKRLTVSAAGVENPVAADNSFSNKSSTPSISRAKYDESTFMPQLYALLQKMF